MLMPLLSVSGKAVAKTGKNQLLQVRDQTQGHEIL